MSRAALEVERAVREMRAQSAKEQQRHGRRTNQSNQEDRVEHEAGQTGHEENQLTGNSKPGMTDVTNLSGQEGAAGGDQAAGATETTTEGKATVVKKAAGGGKKKAAKAAKGPKAPKAPKAAKAAGAAPAERKPRSKVVASGSIKKIEASGTTYLTIEFDEGKVVLTPTGNREQNRDIAVKALRALLKG